MQKEYSARTFKILGLVMTLVLAGLAFVPTAFTLGYTPEFPEYTVGQAIVNLAKDLFGKGTLAVPYASWALYLAAGAFVVTLACFIASLFMKNREKVRALYRFVAVFDALLLFVAAVAVQWTAGYDRKHAFYSAFALYAYFAAIMLCAVSAIGSSGRRTFKILVFLMSAAAAAGMGFATFALKLPNGSVNVSGLRAFYAGDKIYADFSVFLSLVVASKGVRTIVYIALDAVLALVALNLLLSVFCVFAKKNRAFDAVRFLLQFAVAAGAFTYFIIAVDGFDAAKAYGLYAAAGTGLLGFIFSLCYGKAAEEAVTAPVCDTAADAEGQMVMEGVEPAVAPEEPVPANDFFADFTPDSPAEGQISLEELTAEEPAREVAPEPAAEAEIPAEEKAPEAPVPPAFEAPASETPAEPEYKTEYARPVRPVYAEPVYEAPVYAPPQAPQPEPIVRIVPVAVAPAGDAIDGFYESLSAAEKAQFEDLFVNCVLGDNKRLPRYVIGGDNREFFKKVFIFIGRYRTYISTSLLEKLYAQSTKY